MGSVGYRTAERGRRRTARVEGDDRKLSSKPGNAAAPTICRRTEGADERGRAVGGPSSGTEVRNSRCVVEAIAIDWTRGWRPGHIDRITFATGARNGDQARPVSYTHLRAHETVLD